MKHANSILESFEYFCQIRSNTVKIDAYNFELYRFKVGSFLRHSVDHVHYIIRVKASSSYQVKRTYIH